MKNFDQFEKEQKFLDTYIFTGLTDLNTGFDAASIKYFSASDFEIVLQRVKEKGLGIYGIEPWKDGEFYGVETFESYTEDPKDPSWYFSVFEKFKARDNNLQYAASYFVPEDLLTKKISE